ncbi:YceI family protein [Terriglobus aquaticus]|uniref:YceI family protein n=1 Tax=Terriglobus aquaticus TaxID=940139 RepID=A0ABW9KKT2_9BACT|nr:YceI family protein [Terriglobus aquaticus]
MIQSVRRFATGAAVLLAGLAVPAAFAQASTWTIDPAHSGVEFSIKHLGVSTVRGSFSGVTGTVVWDDKNVGASHVEAVIDAKTVNTGQEKRDEHLKSPDFFDVNQYPTLTFKSTSVKRNGDGKLQIVGDLKLGGQTKPVTLDVDGPAAPQKGMGGKLVSGFSAVGTIKRSDFNFGQKYGAPTLGDEVRFTIDLEVAKQ